MRWKRELYWWSLGFAGPAVLLLAMDLVRSPLPVWQQLCSGEDMCSYGVCFIIPLMSYGLVRGVVYVAQWIRRR
jgi:hypothetical protein